MQCIIKVTCHHIKLVLPSLTMALAVPWRAAAFDGRIVKYVEHHQASGRVLQS
jgi:hypothetical protein